MSRQVNISEPRRELGAARLAAFGIMEALFDGIADIVFFVKDVGARYAVVNRTLLTRCGHSAKADVLGKTAKELYPAPFGQSYYAQDMRVLRDGEPIRDKLELQAYPDGSLGWALTGKTPIRDDEGAIIGMVGISRDLHILKSRAGRFGDLAKAIDYVRANYGEPVRIESLATLAGLSVYQFEQRIKRLFHVTAGQFVTHTRMDAAQRLLAESADGIADIAQACGFTDQSAFTRQFKAVTGLTPTAFRTQRRGARTRQSDVKINTPEGTVPGRFSSNVG